MRGNQQAFEAQVGVLPLGTGDPITACMLLKAEARKPENHVSGMT